MNPIKNSVDYWVDILTKIIDLLYCLVSKWKANSGKSDIILFQMCFHQLYEPYHLSSLM